jgi:hypothetical protein
MLLATGRVDVRKGVKRTLGTGKALGDSGRDSQLGRVVAGVAARFLLFVFWRLLDVWCPAKRAKKSQKRRVRDGRRKTV